MEKIKYEEFKQSLKALGLSELVDGLGSDAEKLFDTMLKEFKEAKSSLNEKAKAFENDVSEIEEILKVNVESKEIIDSNNYEDEEVEFTFKFRGEDERVKETIKFLLDVFTSIIIANEEENESKIEHISIEIDSAPIEEDAEDVEEDEYEADDEEDEEYSIYINNLLGDIVDEINDLFEGDRNTFFNSFQEAKLQLEDNDIAQSGDIVCVKTFKDEVRGNEIIISVVIKNDSIKGIYARLAEED